MSWGTTVPEATQGDVFFRKGMGGLISRELVARRELFRVEQY